MRFSETSIVKDQHLARARMHAELHHRHATAAQSILNLFCLSIRNLTHLECFLKKIRTHIYVQTAAADPAHAQDLSRDTQLG
jgi:hypothetical protein